MMDGSAATLDLVDYYRRRAREYERIYEKPERQADLATLRELVGHELAGHGVLEIACGTGYWTQVCAAQADSVLAVDLAEETLEIARAKEYPFGKVRFGKADASVVGCAAAQSDEDFFRAALEGILNELPGAESGSAKRVAFVGRQSP